MKKTINSLMLVAVAVTAFTACNKAADNPVPEKNLVKRAFRFSAFVKDDESKATLTTTDDKTFVANWEKGDRMWVIGTRENEPGSKYFMTSDWDGSEFVSETVDYLEYEPSTCHYRGEYPAGTIKFGPYRTQVGSEYNSLFDPMVGNVTYENAVLGENPSGGSIVIPMNRLTSIVYFHLTSDLGEPITSATLTVEGGAIAANYLNVDNDIAEPDGQTYNSIIITFPKGQAPSARDFQLWYNILPVEATSLTLTVTTDTKIATLRNTKGKSYVAGKINKIVKNGLNWEDDPNAVETITVAQFLEKGVGEELYKLSGTVEQSDIRANTFYLNDGTGSVFVSNLWHTDMPYYFLLYFEDGDELTLTGSRGMTAEGEPFVFNADHFSHVFVPHLTVAPVLEFEANDAQVYKQPEYFIDKFISLTKITLEPVNGSDSRFGVSNTYIYPKMNNTSRETYSEMFTITAFDGKNTLQKQFEVRQRGLGMSSDVDINFNGYNEEIDF